MRVLSITFAVLALCVTACGPAREDPKPAIKAYLDAYGGVLEKMAVGLEAAKAPADALASLRAQAPASREVKKTGDELEKKYPDERKAWRTKFPEENARIQDLLKRIRAALGKFEGDRNFAEELRKLGN